MALFFAHLGRTQSHSPNITMMDEEVITPADEETVTEAPAEESVTEEAAPETVEGGEVA